MRPDAPLCGIRYTAADRTHALKLREEGMAIEDISAKTGASRTTLRRWFQRAKVKHRRHGIPPTRPEITGAVARALWKKHKTAHAAAAAIGMNPSTFMRRAYGYTMVWTHRPDRIEDARQPDTTDAGR